MECNFAKLIDGCFVIKSAFTEYWFLRWVFKRHVLKYDRCFTCVAEMSKHKPQLKWDSYYNDIILLEYKDILNFIIYVIRICDMNL